TAPLPVPSIGSARSTAASSGLAPSCRIRRKAEGRLSMADEEGQVGGGVVGRRSSVFRGSVGSTRWSPGGRKLWPASPTFVVCMAHGANRPLIDERTTDDR